MSTPPALAGHGPFFDDLAVGQEFTSAPAITLTSGLAAVHQAITGDRLALTLDHKLCRQVTGAGPLASPSLVWDVAIGQSTVVTQHVNGAFGSERQVGVLGVRVGESEPGGE